MHSAYEGVLAALHVALREMCLDGVVEVEGPSRLGGFRLSDGPARVAISNIPSRKEDGLDWWVSAWIEIVDEWTPLIAPEDAVFTRRREVTIQRPMTRDDALIAALQILMEMRVRAAWSSAADAHRRENPLANADALWSPAAEPHANGASAEQRDSAMPTLPLGPTSDLVFRTARVRRKASRH